MDELLRQIAAAGVLASILAYAVKTLWTANREERERHAIEAERLREANRAERERHATEEDELRKQIVLESDKHRAEILDLMRRLTRAARDEDSHDGSPAP